MLLIKTSPKLASLAKMVITLGLILLSPQSLASPSIKYHVAERLNDPQKDYFIEVLEQACIHSETEYGVCNLHPVMVDMHQGRQLRSLNTDLLSVMWTMTSVERETNYLPVRIPLTKGLIGVRIAVVNTKSKDQFYRGAQLSRIKQFSVVQGHDWPDIPILRHNGFNVSAINWNNSIYRLLSLETFDYVLRSVVEVKGEVENQQYSNIEIEPNHIFYYPTAIYFFVRKDNQELASRLKLGLEKMIKNGVFDELLFNFPLHQHVKSYLDKQNRILHRLENPFLPTLTPLNEEKLWVIPN